MNDILEFLKNDETGLDRLAMKTYDENGNVIIDCDEEKGWFENGTEQNPYGEWIMTRIYHPYTEEQMLKVQYEKEEAALIESRRQLTLDEVTAIFIKTFLNDVNIPDQTSLRMMEYYPSFDEVIGKTVKMGFKFTYDGKLYKTIQPDVTIQSIHQPLEGVESLYERIDLEHTGKIYDPFPYEGNMALENGKYYTQSNVLYLCFRDTGNPVYHHLKDLVDIYVKVVNKEVK